VVNAYSSPALAKALVGSADDEIDVWRESCLFGRSLRTYQLEVPDRPYPGPMAKGPINWGAKKRVARRANAGRAADAAAENPSAETPRRGLIQATNSRGGIVRNAHAVGDFEMLIDFENCQDMTVIDSSITYSPKDKHK
jgi:hypothetical protein